jgi:hypothetical protein
MLYQLSYTPVTTGKCNDGKTNKAPESDLPAGAFGS